MTLEVLVVDGVEELVVPEPIVEPEAVVDGVEGVAVVVNEVEGIEMVVDVASEVPARLEIECEGTVVAAEAPIGAAGKLAAEETATSAP